MSEPTRATRLLQRVEHGDAAAADELLPLVYDELRRLAEHQMANEAAGHTLQPTALVHEAWMRMVDDLGASQGGRRRFFGFAAHVMRNVLVDHARKRRAAKRGGERARLELEDAVVLYEDNAHDLIELDEALARLAEFDEQLVRIVELRFFAGLGAREAAEVLDMPLRSLERGLATARAWLRGAMADR